MKRILLILAFVLLWSQSAWADTFGNSAGANDGEGGATNPTCSIFTPASSGTITKITARFNWSSSDSNFRVAIYNASAGTPTTFIAQSSSDVLITATGDYDATVSASITGGASYALCVFTNGGDAGVLFTNGSSGDGHQEVGTYPTFPSPYGTDFPNTNLYRIWATYTPSGGATCKGGLTLLGVGGC